jgi:hypothetical protein
LELHEPDPEVRELLAENFSNWVSAIEGCLEDMGARLPASLDRKALAEFILTVMEGAVMQSRTHREIGVYDRNVAMLRAHIDHLEASARARPPTMQREDSDGS